MKRHISKPIIFGGIAAAVVLAAGIAALATNSPSSSGATHITSKQTAKTKTPTVNANGPAASSTANASGQPTSKTSGAATPTVSTSCKLLTLPVAQQTLGAGAKTSTPTNTVALKTADTSVNACAYSGANGTAQLVVRTANDSLGASENATVFGSERPSGAITLEGYGQTAYWDPGKQQLNILGNNNWYIITRSTGTQSDAEAVAKQMVSGF